MLERVLASVERLGFTFALKHPTFFRHVARRFAYRNRSDPEDVHAYALDLLKKHESAIEQHAAFFDNGLRVEIKGKPVKPIGTAAGMDKNAESLAPLSHVFGFQEVGTIVKEPRQGNPQPRIAVDNQNEDMFNAQGFPSKGLDYALDNIVRYRERGDAIIYASVCGLPNESDPVESAKRELGELCYHLAPHVDGFVWNPFSPNTASLTELRTPESFDAHAHLLRAMGKDKLILVKMGPIMDDGTHWLELLDAFMQGGGDGASMVNTYMVDKTQVPSTNWGYPSAGKSGRYLREHRMRALKTARSAFPQGIFFGTGGIYEKQDVHDTLNHADAIQGYTPYTFYGLGLVRKQLQWAKEFIDASQ